MFASELRCSSSQRRPRLKNTRVPSAGRSQAVEHRLAAANVQLQQGLMHHATTASRESPYYKRLINESFSASPTSRPCLLQLAFPASRLEQRKQSCFPLQTRETRLSGASGTAATNPVVAKKRLMASEPTVTKSTTEKSESAYKLRVFAKQQILLVSRSRQLVAGHQGPAMRLPVRQKFYYSESY